MQMLEKLIVQDVLDSFFISSLFVDFSMKYKIDIFIEDW